MSKENYENSPTLKILNEFLSLVVKYPPAYITEAKPKREAAIAKCANETYKVHNIFKNPINEFGNSVLLVCNDLAFPYMAREIGQFCACLEIFQQGIKKANSVQELQLYYKQFNLKPKDVIDEFMLEINDYIQEYGVDIDKKEIMQLLKDAKQDSLLKVGK